MKPTSTVRLALTQLVGGTASMTGTDGASGYAVELPEQEWVGLGRPGQVEVTITQHNPDEGALAIPHSYAPPTSETWAQPLAGARTQDGEA